MADQMGTPSSNADNSINGAKTFSASKDKACPFCQQQYTSSSLGRHLDLYIKEKHPKPPDGIHIVDEIRKIRGGITRRQPRQSLRRRDTSTPGDHDQASPLPDSTAEDGSPISATQEDVGSSNLMFAGRPRMFMQPPTWEATGVINDIPAAKMSDSGKVDSEDKEFRRIDARSRQVNKQVLAKAAFEQKQKMLEALDTAKAAELALRELLGSLRAANRQKFTSVDIFDYDPLTLDFPSLCLQCLPPPPTLHAAVPIHHPNTWNISPPGDNQYEALRAHFATAFRNHRNKLAIASTAPVDDLSYPPPAHNYAFPDQDPAAQVLDAEVQTNELEQKVNNHIHDVFGAWTSLSASRRSEVWTTELARSVGRKSTEIESLKKEKEYETQVVDHLRQQNDDISRLQHPREFRMVPPQTIPVSQEILNMFGEGRERRRDNPLVGFNILDRSEKTDVIVERAVARWRNVVREARGASQNGMHNQRSMSDGSHIQQSSNNKHMSGFQSASLATPIARRNNGSGVNVSMQDSHGGEAFDTGDVGEDADADADADMEEDTTYAEMGDINGLSHAGNELQHGNGLRPTSYSITRNGTRQEGDAVMN